MKLAYETTVRITEAQSNIIGHMCYASGKLWNIANYERRNWKDLGFDKAPTWYSQKKALKDNVFYRSLPSQSAQELLKKLDGAWKSYRSNKKSGKIQNPRPPRFKQPGENLPVTFIQNAIRFGRKLNDDPNEPTVRLSLSGQLKKHMQEKYGIKDDYLWIKSSAFATIDPGRIKQITFYPPEKNVCRMIIVYEVPDVAPVKDNGHYLGIDFGLHNFFTCYDSQGGSFIVGREYLAIRNRYHREISLIQEQWYAQQSREGVKYPKSSTHIRGMYDKMNRCVKDYLHKITRFVADYCAANEISVVVVGDWKGIRSGNSKGKKFNQKLHQFPFDRVYDLLSYKLAQVGIVMIKQNEAWTSQCSPLTPEVSKKYATPQGRVHRGLYKVGSMIWNADSVGAFNILRKWMANAHPGIHLDPGNIGTPYVVKVAV